MACEHDLRAVNPFNTPDHEGNNVEIVGAPPQSKEEPAWCRICGALWTTRAFGLGWGFQYPETDTAAPTLLNLMREAGPGEKKH